MSQIEKQMTLNRAVDLKQGLGVPQTNKCEMLYCVFFMPKLNEKLTSLRFLLFYWQFSNEDLKFDWTIKT